MGNISKTSKSTLGASLGGQNVTENDQLGELLYNLEISYLACLGPSLDFPSVVLAYKSMTVMGSKVTIF